MYNLLLQILRRRHPHGQLRRKINFKNTIIIMDVERRRLRSQAQHGHGLHQASESDDYERMETTIRRAKMLRRNS